MDELDSLRMCAYLCKVDGSARRQVVHFIECLYRPPVTRVGVGKTADRAGANYYYCCRMPARSALFICDDGAR